MSQGNEYTESQGNEYTEADLDAAFELDVRYGLEMLHDGFQQRLMRQIAACAPRLKADDIGEIYNDTFVSMARLASGPSFEFQGSIRIALTIAKRRTIDHLKREKVRRTVDFDVETVAEEDGHNKEHYGEEFEGLGADEQKILWKTIFDVVDGLPAKQRDVALAYFDVYEEVIKKRSYVPLKEKVASTSKEDVTVAQVKSNWHEAKKKIAARLSTIQAFKSWGGIYD